MSDGGNKKNVGDIQSLRARLGMLKKGSSINANPTVPGAEHPGDQSLSQQGHESGEIDSTINTPGSDFQEQDQSLSQADWSGEAERTEAQELGSIGSSSVSAPEEPMTSEEIDESLADPGQPDAVNALLGAQAEPKVPTAASPMKARESLSMPQAPAAPMGRSSFDVFSHTATPTANQGQTLEPQPQQRAEETAQNQGTENRGNVNFANPLQVGTYGNAQPSIDLSASESEALQSFEASEKGIRLPLAAFMTLSVAIVTLIFGFLIGDIRNARRMINLQIDSNVRLADNMRGPLSELDALKRIILATDNTAVDWAKVEAIPAELAQLDAGLLLSSPVPLSRELSRQLANILVDMEMLFSAVRQHRNITLVRDRAELENIEKGSEFNRNTHFAVVYKPNPPRTKKLAYIPPKGRIVAVVGQPKLTTNRKDRVLPIKTRAGETSDVSLTKVLVIDKKEFVESEQTNALSAYRKRVQTLKEQVQKIEQYDTMFRQKLKEEAEREKVFSI